VPDVAVVVNLHREGRLAHPTFRSLARGVDQATSDGLTVEVVLVLDRADEPTRAYVADALGPGGSLSGLRNTLTIEVDNGDLGLSRNDGIKATTAGKISCLDADDLITRTWLTQASKFLDDQSGTVVAHPAVLVMFGSRKRLSPPRRDCVLYPMARNLRPGLRLDLLYEFNFLATFVMAPREVFERHPYVPTGPGLQLGPEDWHWNCETVADGTQHLAVPGTSFYYRVKTGGSLVIAHQASRSLLPRTRLLTSRDVASTSPAKLPDRRQPKPEPRDVLPDLVTLALKDLDPHDDERDGSVDYRRFKGSGMPSLLTWWALRPNRFNAAHYRLLHPDLDHLTFRELVNHYLRWGRAEKRKGRLDPSQVESLRLAAFDPVEYRSLNADLISMTNLQATRHFLTRGWKEDHRRTSLSASERRDLESLLDPIRDDWQETQHIEPALPPPPLHFSDIAWQHGGDIGSIWRPASWVYWKVVRKLPQPVDVVFVAPWMRDGVADQALIRYAAAVRKNRPDWSVALITTHRDRSTHLDAVPEGVTVVELGRILNRVDLKVDQQERLLATVVLQFQPRMLHVFNSALGFDTVEHFGEVLSRGTRIFLAAFEPDKDSQRNNGTDWYLLGRNADFLDPVSAVIVDHEAIARTIHEITAAGAEKFVVHHQVVFPADHPRHQANPKRRNILWAEPFDHETRLDLLAGVAEELARAGGDAKIHFYGDEDEKAASPRFANDLARLKAAGAVRHPAVTDFQSLPLDDFALCLITGEREGIPQHLLEAASAGIPVVAPATGGVLEVLTAERGFLTGDPESIEGYVAQIGAVLDDPESAQLRANKARTFVEAEFSEAVSEERLASLPGYLDL
jgi:glycosyltransferase involved in cell wall biosynthesis